MIFNILSSSIGVSKWGTAHGSRSISFQIEPQDRTCIEIGEKYVVCSVGYHRLLHQDRERLTVKAYVMNDRSNAGIEDEANKEICGWASFYPEQEGSLEYSPPALKIRVAIEDQLFDDLFNLRIGESGSATMHLGIEELEFGWEPDGSRQIWLLDQSAEEVFASRKPVDSFWVNVETFSTTELEIAEQKERKEIAELVDSPDLKDRKLAASLSPIVREDSAVRILRQCLIVLTGLLIVAVISLMKT